MAEKKTSLRVLYTINSSPQYILARSHAQVSVSLIPPTEDDSNPPSANASQPQALYASVLLSTCLDTICRSSPELTQDSSRDFSIYVLDPLESNSAPAPVHISNANGDPSYSQNNASSSEQPRGVAVGLGLMSWALTGDDRDTMSVVGTLVKQGTGQAALEVIFALRETMAMKKPAWNLPAASSQSSSSQDNAGTLSSSQGNVKMAQTHASSSQATFSCQSRTQLSSLSCSTRSTTDLTRETVTSIQMRAKAKVKRPKPVRQSTIPVTESDKLMNADTYIGPVKKKGRPKTSNAGSKPATVQNNAVASDSGSRSTAKEKEVIVIDGSDSECSVPTATGSNFQKVVNSSRKPSDATKKKHSSHRSETPPFTPNRLVQCSPESVANKAPAQVKFEPQEEPSLLDILAYFSATSPSEPNAQNAAILAALNTIDSADTQSNALPDNAPNPALVSALKQLLSVCVNPSASVQLEPSHHHHHRSSSSSQGDGIIVLDKENVNPIVFKKRAEKECQDSRFPEPIHTPMSSSATTSSGHSSHSDRQVQRLGPSMRSNGSNSVKIPSKGSFPASGTTKVVRKRTLSDFMDERESGRKREKGKERERIERPDNHRHSYPQRPQKSPDSDSLRHYPRLLDSNQPRTEQPANYYRTPLEAWTSPARPRVETDEITQNATAESSGSQSPGRPPSPRQRVSASSPVRSSQQETRKKYIVPKWARTSTATQPRLSEEAQHALEELEEKKKQERLAARRRLSSMQGKLKGKSSTSTLKAAKPIDQHPRQELVPKKPEAARGPIAACSSGPLFAAASIAFPIIASSRSSSPSPNAHFIPKTPKTPTRNRHNVRPTPGRENDSLFTPVMRSGSLFGSAYSQHSPHGSLPSVLTSPLGNRKKAKISPMRSILTGKGLSGPSAWASSGSPKSSTDSVNAEERQELKQSLERELEDALDDLDCPPSSLPIASSDIDVDESNPQTSGGADLDIEDDVETVPVKQHWAGLPPSSPPAPSSPMLLPENDPQTDDEMDDLPIATSDSEADADMDSFESDATCWTGESPVYSNEQLAESMSAEDLAAFFSTDTHSSDSQHLSPSAMDIFEQFTNLNAQSDDFQSFDGAAITDHELDGIDFTEFWETFKPLVNDSTQVPHNPTDVDTSSFFEAGTAALLAPFGEIDHAKLADDMQALLSGCLM